MAYINWGHETPEQKEIRRRFEEQELFEQAMVAYARSSSAMAGAAGSGKTIASGGWIEAALANLNSRYTEITSLVPDIYYFSDESRDLPYSIGDGGNDMYDNGNYMNTNLTGDWDNIKDSRVNSGIPYTHTKKDSGSGNYTDPPMDGEILEGDQYFGNSSKYFTNMYPGLFVMAAENVKVSEFNIGGNVGSDGQGYGAAYTLNIGNGWTLFFKQNYDNNQGDPSINQLILIPGSQIGIDHYWDTRSQHDDHRVYNINGRDKIIYALVARQPGQGPISDSDAIVIAEKILEIAL